MEANFSPLGPLGLAHHNFYPLQGTVALAETSFVAPDSPESLGDFKEEEEEEAEKKPTKKRKSWGQELPTPKTNLPPRKRAKTEDEKEQRRIERVLRNRQAAQSSRERKRQEVEKLEGEKHEIEVQNQRLKERLMAVEHERFLLNQQVHRLTAQVRAIKRQNPNTPVSMASGASSPSLDADRQDQEAIKQELEDYAVFLPTPQKSIDLSLFHSRPSSSCSFSPSPSEFGLGGSALDIPSDLTQHPAAMLCGLQCQSEGVNSTPFPPATRRSRSRLAFMQLLSLTLASVIYSQLLRPLRSIFLSTRTGSPRPSRTSLRPAPGTNFPLIRWLISTPANLNPRPKTSSSISTRTTNTTTPTTIPMPIPKASTPPSTPLRTTRRAISRLRLSRRLLFCSLALARPRRDATSTAMRKQTRRWLTEISTRSLRGAWNGKGDVVDAEEDGSEPRTVVEDKELVHERIAREEEQWAMMIQAMRTMFQKGTADRHFRSRIRKKCTSSRRTRR